MKVPCCSVCQTRYNEKERVPLLLQCGHGFCKECLSRMFSASTDTTLSCPRCRHVSVVGNSVTALRKNFAVLALILSATSANNTSHHTNHHNNTIHSNFDSDVTDDDDDEDCDDDEVNHTNNNLEDGDVPGRSGRGSHASSSGVCGPVIEVGVHHDVKLVKKFGEGRRAGVEVWGAWIGGAQGRCRHSVVVKKVSIGEEMEVDWVSGQLDNLRRASMWCRNVCTFHGVLRMDGCLGLVMDRCYGSVQSAMQRNEGRLTLEQILRFCFTLFLINSPGNAILWMNYLFRVVIWWWVVRWVCVFKFVYTVEVVIPFAVLLY